MSCIAGIVDSPTSLTDWGKEESKLILGFWDFGVPNTLTRMGTLRSRAGWEGKWQIRCLIFEIRLFLSPPILLCHPSQVRAKLWLPLYTWRVAQIRPSECLVNEYPLWISSPLLILSVLDLDLIISHLNNYKIEDNPAHTAVFVWIRTRTPLWVYELEKCTLIWVVAALCSGLGKQSTPL